MLSKFILRASFCALVVVAFHQECLGEELPSQLTDVTDSPAEADVESLKAADIFDRHMLPIRRADTPSNCTECYFGGVELKNYYEMG